MKMGHSMMDRTTCVYAGSFDPPTQGHLFMIERGSELFDRLVVAVGINPEKDYTFSVEERMEMLRACIEHHENVTVESFENQYLVNYASNIGADYILRGIRSHQDYEFERAMRNVNEDLNPGITSVFLMPPREVCEVSSSFVKGMVGPRGWRDAIRPYVPRPVLEKLLERPINWNGQSGGAEDASD